jgi:fluoroacetyl-CoA thioesterase
VLPIAIGETATLDVVVTPAHTVDFDELGKVHPVYATYTMAKHFEEAGRKLLVQHLEPGEAGIGTAVSVEHLAPSWVGDELRVTARCTELRDGRLTCECRARGRARGPRRRPGAAQPLISRRAHRSPPAPPRTS